MLKKPEFVFGLNPVVQAEGCGEQTAVMESLTRYLERAMEMPVRLTVHATYEAQINAMRLGELDAASFGAYAFYVAQSESVAEAIVVSVELSSGRPTTYQTVFVVHDASPIYHLSDLHGATIAFVDENSTSGYLIPRQMLRSAGVDPDAEIVSKYHFTHEAVAASVSAGRVAAGALHQGLFAQVIEQGGPEASSLRVIAMSPPVPTGPVATRRDLDREVRQRLLHALLRIHEEVPKAANVLYVPGHRWRPASNRHITLKTVAALAGVSYGTVSRVINGGVNVAPETFARVTSVVWDLGFRPNAAAVGLMARRSNLVGFVVPDPSDPAVARYGKGLQHALADLGLHTVLCPTYGDRAEEAHYLGLLDDGHFDGLALTPWSIETPAVTTLAAAGRPLVMLGVTDGSAPVPSVGPRIDQTNAIAVAHLRELGHERIDGIGFPSQTLSLQRRLMADGATGDVKSVTEDDPGLAMRLAQELLGLANPPSAVICGTERMALGVLQAAFDRHISVPALLSVLSLSESWIVAAATPPLTTVSSSPEALGEQAALLLVARIEGAPVRKMLPLPPSPSLLRRGSTAACPPHLRLTKN